MRKKLPKKIKQPPRQCIFCDNMVDSKEHFWSEWTHEFLPAKDDTRHSRQIITFHPSEGEQVRGATGRQGDPRSIKVRAVCADCNNGWMSRLEEEAKPLLIPLIAGTAIKLTPSQIAVVAKWITLKCMVGEHDRGDSAATPRRDRIAFKESGTIPSYFRIYMTSQQSGAATGFLRHSQCIWFQRTHPSPPLDGVPNNIQTISFILGSVFIHLNAARIENFELESRVLPRFILKSGCVVTFWDVARIWPLTGLVASFPRRPLLDTRSIDIISDVLGEYGRASQSTWLPLPK